MYQRGNYICKETVAAAMYVVEDAGIELVIEEKVDRGILSWGGPCVDLPNDKEELHPTKTQDGCNDDEPDSDGVGRRGDGREGGDDCNGED